MSYNENGVSYYWNGVVADVSCESYNENCVEGNWIATIGSEEFVSCFWDGGL